MTTIVDTPGYTAQEKRQALTVFAMVSGSADLAGRMLAESGLGHIKVSTVQQWAYRSMREEYAQIKGEVDGHVRSQFADNYRQGAALHLEVSFEAARQMKVALEEGKISYRELPKLAQQAMLAAGIATDKGELLSGNPTSNVKTDMEDVQREAAALGITVIVGAPPVEKGPPVIEHPALPAGEDEPET